jgi:PPM family protein phosphatase
MNQHNTFSYEPPLHLSVAGHSETGRLLEGNADAFALFDLAEASQAERGGRLYLLADGIGSHPGGEIASRIAVETIPATYYHRSEGDSPLGRLQQAFLAAHTRIHEFTAQHPEYTGMATTCTAVVIRGTRIWIAHVGDSRAYLIRASSRPRPTIMRLTTDHSLVAAQVRAGDLTPDQMRHSPADRDILLRALGGSEENHPYPDFTMHEVRAGDVLMLCSDGLWSAATEEQIARIVSSMPAQQACEALVRLADEAAGDENISVVMLSFSSSVEHSSHNNWRSALCSAGGKRS